MAGPVPDGYTDTVAAGVEILSKGADLVMFVTEMLGNDTFELDTAHGYKIVISKNADSEAVVTKQS
jgi:hypothetical protein